MRRIEQVTQISQTTFPSYGPVQRLQHQTIAGFVERQLYPDLLCSLQINDTRVVRYGNHHAVAIDIANNTRKREIADA